jgi:hypothetical protein
MDFDSSWVPWACSIIYAIWILKSKGSLAIGEVLAVASDCPRSSKRIG